MATLLAIVLVFVTATLEGYVLSVLWGWFIVPVFAAPALRIPYAVGLALIVSMLTHKSKKPDDEPELPTILATALVVPPIFLGCGWIVKLFV